MNAEQVIGEVEDLSPSGYPVKIYCNGELFDIMNITVQSSEDPDIEPAIVIRAQPK